MSEGKPTPEQKRRMLHRIIRRNEELIEEGYTGTIEFRYDKGFLQKPVRVGKTELLAD